MTDETHDTTDGGDEDHAETAPAVVLPSPNAVSLNGGLQGVAGGVSPIAPQPLLAPSGAHAPDLADRLEQALNDDGRFDAYVSQIVIIADDDGTVHLTGRLPSEGQRHGLLTVVRGLPGVTNIDDRLQTD